MPADWRVPQPARVAARTQESPSVFTIKLELCDPAARAGYRFLPGQFNMLYLPGAGEVPISIVSDPDEPEAIGHTIRAVGRVTRGLARLAVGDRIGLRGPFGSAWPLAALRGRDLLLVTGGLGCAPLVSVIEYVMRRRAEYGRLAILQGVKHMDDLIWRERYEQWAQRPDTEVLLAADVGGPGWRWHVGLVTELFDRLQFDVTGAAVLLCGPEPMMLASIGRLRDRGVPAEDIWLSMERNMQCAVGLCGHCQHGPQFVCRDGAVFGLPQIAARLGVKGF